MPANTYFGECLPTIYDTSQYFMTLHYDKRKSLRGIWNFVIMNCRTRRAEQLESYDFAMNQFRENELQPCDDADDDDAMMTTTH